MISIIRLDENDSWDTIVRSFPDYDVYYLSGYVRAFALHGDGEPVLVYYRTSAGRAICVLMLRDVADDPVFNGLIPCNEYRDAVTPYGYGGFIYEGDVDIAALSEEFMTLLKGQGIISVFFRFHPVLANAIPFPGIDVIPLGKTIALDLESEETIWLNITSKTRNKIRKAEKLGVEIKHGKGKELLREFRFIYNATMDHDNAEPYYYFGEEFYQSVDSELKDNYEIFYAVYEGEIIAMSIMMFANGRMNYHLSGSKFQYRNLAPTNLLLYKAALWGMKQGLTTLHLGGGLGAEEDSLYTFKAGFNRNSNYMFSIGKAIVDKDKYDGLLKIRSLMDEQISNIHYFPKYRAHIG